VKGEIVVIENALCWKIQETPSASNQ